jgi:hypothetical protein
MPSKDKLRRQKEKEEEKDRIEQEKLLDEYWNEGTNKKAEKKAQLENERQMEKIQRQKEKKELEEADRLINENTSIKIKKGKKNKDGDFELLNQALKSMPKTKAQKELERKQQAREYQKQQEELLKLKKKEREELQEKEKRENLQKGISYSHNEIMDIEINNTLEEGEEYITGIDNILDNFSNNNENKFITYDQFYNQQLEILKQETPGLRLSQYKDKIVSLWKKSPYNKNNIN